jgi:Rrf2 family protein
MLSRTCKYALQAIVLLASKGQEAMTTQDIANGTNIPVSYLAKVMQLLVKAAVVKSQRGLNGGFRIVKDTKDLNLFEVINAVDPIRKCASCPLGMSCDCASLCPLFKKLAAIDAMTYEAYRNTTVAELVTVKQKACKHSS